LTRIPTRLRALAVTTLAAVVLLSTSTTGDAVAARTPDGPPTSALLGLDAGLQSAEDQASPAAPDPTLAPALAAEVASSESTGTVEAAPATVRTAAAPDVVSASSVVVAFARSHLRARYQHYATGPSSFDCSGLMWRVFTEAGLSRKVGSRSARGIYVSYRARGLASRRNPQIGDLVVWGQGSHVGVYIGRGYAISALVQGVRIHRIGAMFTPFTAYLHTHLSSLMKPAWELELARHMRSLRHATRTVTLRATSGGTRIGRLGHGTRLVVLARQRDHGQLWLRVLTFSGRTGWLPATATAR
jgi:cell wall-associated NlpC family hydrolase